MTYEENTPPIITETLSKEATSDILFLLFHDPKFSSAFNDLMDIMPKSPPASSRGEVMRSKNYCTYLEIFRDFYKRETSQKYLFEHHNLNPRNHKPHLWVGINIFYSFVFQHIDSTVNSLDVPRKPFAEFPANLVTEKTEEIGKEMKDRLAEMGIDGDDLLLLLDLAYASV